jgi:hypothetical protein
MTREITRTGSRVQRAAVTARSTGRIFAFDRRGRLALLDEETTLAQAVSLLMRRAPIGEWPDEIVGALRRAMSEDGLRPAEADKAFALRRHLFGTAAPGLGAGAAHPAEGRRAERLRADLPKLVPLRAGLGCLPGSPASTRSSE